MTTAAPEKFLPPKELSEALCRDYGLCVSAEYIRAIRRDSQSAGDRLFIAGQARAGEVLRWLETHPEFRVRPRVRPAVA